MKTKIDFEELENLYYLGFTLHWLRPKEKRPVESKWTTAPRPSWETFKESYRPGYNVGVRLGKVSKIGKRYLAVIDLDIKSVSNSDYALAREKVFELFPAARYAPYCISGRGNGSGHFYVVTDQPIRGNERKAQSEITVKVRMPSVKPSARELAELSTYELDEGVRLRAAWEISLMSEGRQVVLPGSVHPDSGRLYTWAPGRTPLDVEMPHVEATGEVSTASKEVVAEPVKRNFPDCFDAVQGLSAEHQAQLTTGEGVTDRSATMFSITLALLRRKVSEEVIVSIFTNRSFFLGNTAFDHAKTTNRNKAARWVERYCLPNAKRVINENTFEIAVTEEKKKNPTIDSIPVVAPNWQSALDLQPGPKGAQPTLRHTYKNLRLILQNEVSYELLKRNEFANEDVFQVDTPWGYEKGRKRSGNGDDALRVKTWLIQSYGVEAPIFQIEEALNSIACENAFHPVRDFLDGLEWDGKSRVSNAFKTYLGAVMPEPYLSSVSRKFFLALVSRIYEPGIKFDHLPVFEGDQGIGKSSFGSILVGNEWFLDGLPDLADKDAALNLQGIWLCEMGELSSLFRSQIETAKAFIVRTTDKLRPPYGHRRIDLARQNIFYGTTNLRDYLIDATGNRRYWPVLVHGCDFRRLKRDRKQLLAEAKYLYDYSPENLWLQGKAKAQAEVIQENRRVTDESDSFEIRFLDWAEKKPEGFDLKDLSMGDLFQSGPWMPYQPTMPNFRFAGMVLRKLGYEKHPTKKGKRWLKAR